MISFNPGDEKRIVKRQIKQEQFADACYVCSTYKLGWPQHIKNKCRRCHGTNMPTMLFEYVNEIDRQREIMLKHIRRVFKSEYNHKCSICFGTGKQAIDFGEYDTCGTCQGTGIPIHILHWSETIEIKSLCQLNK
jgi:RecJ-like exonuclease